MLKRILVGSPIATDQQEHQKIPKTIALAVFSSDAISSTAYAVEEVLFAVALGASSLDKGLSVLVPIGIGVAVLLAIVITSYRQTIYAYPQGGGSYVVSRENLGKYPSLLAGASILVDYVLTVAVSISAGVAAIISIPTFRDLAEHRVGIGLFLIGLITLMNLRGIKESGRVFAAPTYVYIGVLGGLVVYGLFREFLGGGIEHIHFDAEHFEGQRQAGGTLGLFLILKGFSQGAVALTGIEAIADGVPAFRKPEARNASITLLAMAIILGTLFFGTAVLAHHLRPYPSHEETVISQLGRAVYGQGPLYIALQFATAAILVLAANTAYADFPRLSSIIARDGYLPRQFGNRGDRLVFSNGVLFLAVAAGVLLWAFGGITNSLIALYAVGVFTSFTLSQAGMVRYHTRHKKPGWRVRAAISATGTTATFIVLLIVGITRFAAGAWVSVVVVGAIMAIFLAIKRHYDRITRALVITPSEVRPEAVNHTVVVLVSRVDRRVLKALNYAKSLRPNHLAAVCVAQEDGDREKIQAQWDEFNLDVPLEIIHSPYRDLVEPVEKFLLELDARWANDTITVVIPEFVLGKGIAGKWIFENVLHNQSALALKLALLYRPNTVVTSVPYHVDAINPTA